MAISHLFPYIHRPKSEHTEVDEDTRKDKIMHVPVIKPVNASLCHQLYSLSGLMMSQTMLVRILLLTRPKMLTGATVN